MTSVAPHSSAQALAGATVRVPGTCGEFVQGVIGDTSFHISCPIDVFARVRAEVYAGPLAVSCPPEKPKVRDAVLHALNLLGETQVSVSITVDNPLAPGKGMGSSTADIAGAVWATARALGQEIGPRDVAAIALKVEPTNGSIFPGLALFDHRGGALFEDLGPPLPMAVLALDFGGVVDTLAFNASRNEQVARALTPQTHEALQLVRRGLADRDPRLIGRGATLSAIANQRLLYKRELQEVVRFAESIDALGVVAAHSGVVLGVLLDPQADARRLAGLARKELPLLESVRVAKVIGGGPVWAS